MMTLTAAVMLVLLTSGSRQAAALNVDVTHFTLDNGLQVVVIPDRRAPIVTNMVWYRVGAADEPIGKAGIAHFLEHLLFKGTEKLQAGEFSKIVRRNGGEDNAFTTHDFTAYYQRIAKDRLDLVMGLEADRMVNLRLTDDDIKPEKAVVKEERRSRTDNDPSSLLSEQVSAALYIAHPYGRPVIGWMSDVNGLTRADAEAFYRQYYTPSNAIVVIAGDVTTDEVRKLVDKHFAPLKNTAQPGERARTPEPEPLAARRITMVDERSANPFLQRSYLADNYRSGGKGHGHALEVLSTIIGGGPTSRLYRELVVDSSKASYAGAWYDGDSLDEGTFGVYAAPAHGVTIEVVEKALDASLQSIVRDGITAEELKLAKSSLLASTVYALDSQFQLAYLFGSALTTGNTVEDVLNWSKVIENMTVEQVNAAARDVLQIKRSVTGILLQKQQTASN
jgi:zinc protease